MGRKEAAKVGAAVETSLEPCRFFDSSDVSERCGAADEVPNQVMPKCYSVSAEFGTSVEVLKGTSIRGELKTTGAGVGH